MAQSTHSQSWSVIEGMLTAVLGRLIPLELLSMPPAVQLQMKLVGGFFGADEAEHAVFDEHAIADLHVVDEVGIGGADAALLAVDRLRAG